MTGDRLRWYAGVVAAMCPNPPCEVRREFCIRKFVSYFAHKGDPNPEHWLYIPDALLVRARTRRWMELQVLKWLRRLHQWEGADQHGNG